MTISQSTSASLERSLDSLPPLDILVVDDDQYINRLVQVRLKNTGYLARSAGDGAEAIATIRANPPDLLFLDVSMPEIDGLEVLKTIRAENRDIAVIMMTAFGSESVAVEALRLGADDYLRKPFEPAEFQAVFSRTARRLILARQNAHLQARLAQEMQRAAQVQLDLLPHATLHIPGFTLAAHFQPARAVSGDFYDWYLDSQGYPTLTLGDVMGKGMPAALLMATVRATMRAAGRDRSPGDALATAAASLGPDLERSESFVTLFHARLHPGDRTLTYSNAGHGLGFVLRHDGTTEPIVAHAMPLGILPEDAYAETVLHFAPGDKLYTYSDGLVDAPGQLEEQALIDIARQTGDVALAVTALVEQALAQATELPDDLTVLALGCAEWVQSG